MKKTFIITVLAMALSTAFAQNGEKAITFSVGFAYNQIWLQGNLYGADEYGVSSSPFNWGVSPFFSMRKNRWTFNFGCSYMSFSRNYRYSETHFYVDKWQEASLASTVGFRVTGERQLINVTPFLGIDLSYLINYEKDVTMGTSTRHYNTDELEARNYHDIYVWNDIPIPFGLDVLGGINVSCPIAKHFEIGISYCMKFKIINDIRNFTTAHNISITSPVLYHNASIGVAYRFN